MPMRKQAIELIDQIDQIDLIGNLLSHQLLKQVVGVLGGCGHGKRDLLRD